MYFWSSLGQILGVPTNKRMTRGKVIIKEKFLKLGEPSANEKIVVLLASSADG